jgi:hypothetical protein
MSVFTRYDRSTFYGGDSRGYTDYPWLSSEAPLETGQKTAVPNAGGAAHCRLANALRGANAGLFSSSHQ